MGVKLFASTMPGGGRGVAEEDMQGHTAARLAQRNITVSVESRLPQSVFSCIISSHICW